MTGPTSLWDGLLQALLLVIPLMLSLTVHEFAHARAACWLGDSTAERLGRLTLNPLAHLDPLGSVVLPMVVLVLSGTGAVPALPMFAWARPVPVNAGNFRRSLSVRRGMLWVAIAGPMANLLLAAGCAVVLVHAQGLWPAALRGPMERLGGTMLLINAGLCVLNLLPIGALDGVKIVCGLLPTAQAVADERFNLRYGLWMLLGLAVVAQSVLVMPVRFLAGLLLRGAQGAW